MLCSIEKLANHPDYEIIPDAETAVSSYQLKWNPYKVHANPIGVSFDILSNIRSLSSTTSTCSITDSLPSSGSSINIIDKSVTTTSDSLTRKQEEDDDKIYEGKTRSRLYTEEPPLKKIRLTNNNSILSIAS